VARKDLAAQLTEGAVAKIAEGHHQVRRMATHLAVEVLRARHLGEARLALGTAHLLERTRQFAQRGVDIVRLDAAIRVVGAQVEAHTGVISAFGPSARSGPVHVGVAEASSLRRLVTGREPALPT